MLKNYNSDSLDEEPITFQHSSYIDDDELINKLKTKRNPFIILSLNCQSFNTKIYEIKIVMEKLKYNLYATWLSDKSDTSLLKLDYYNLISQVKICTTHVFGNIY